ncbi:CPBP family glutamic-type intramembrane protease [Halobacillus andaensis]|uniref:CPBP family glutamic-type intramembrane protease n=1 Tax=Halobacillus andaensis TaxID=1176239 RepID=UPI003D75B263
MNKKKILIYCLWLYGLSFGSGTLFFLSELASNSQLVGIFMTFYMLFPLIAAFIVQKLIYKERLARPFLMTGRPGKWWLIAAVLPLVLVGATACVALLFPGVTLDLGMEAYRARVSPEQSDAMDELFNMFPFHPLLLLIIQALLAGVTVNAVFTFGEEVGWRGFLLREFRPLGFWKASLLIGMLWGPWHAPLTLFAGHNYPSHPVLGLFMMTVFCMLLSPILSYVTIVSRSIFPAVFFHGVVNSSTSIGIMIVAGGHPEWLNGLTGLAGFIVLFVVCLLLFIRTRNTIQEKYDYAYKEGIET